MAPLSGTDPRHLGGFRVLTLLAVGGMGRVYLALGPDRRAVALKVARPEFAADARFRARFRREVATAREVGVGAAGLIAPVVAADPEAELPWLASEYVPGPSVTDAVLHIGPLAGAGLRTLAHGLARALAEVHAAGVVHRDVKPSNVLLARDGPRLIDFGVARAIDDVSLTRVGALIGSPGFLSPEQAVGDPATFGSDVFAMAAVVVYAARGQSPFGAGDGTALLYRVVHEPPKLDGIPADLADVLAACLAKDPAGRPTAAEVAAHAAPADPWLPEAALDDIARREAELAAWLEVTAAGSVWERAKPPTAGFDRVADTALGIANARVSQPMHQGSRRRKAEPGGAPGVGREAGRGADDVAVPGFGREAGRGADDVTVPGFGARSGFETAGGGRSREPGADASAPELNSPADHTRPPGADARQPAIGSRRRADSPADQVREPGLRRTSTAHTEAADAALRPDRPRVASTKPGAAYTAFLLDKASAPAPEPEPQPKPRPHPEPDLASTTHHRAPRPRRFPVYAALGAVVGAAVTAVVLLLPHGSHGGHSAPPASPSPSATQKAAPSTPAGGPGGLGRSAVTTSASGSPR